MSGTPSASAILRAISSFRRPALNVGVMLPVAPGPSLTCDTSTEALEFTRRDPAGTGRLAARAL